MLEKHDYANISRCDAHIALDMHAVHDGTGSILFAEAEAAPPVLRILGSNCDPDPGCRPIFGDLDETRRAPYPIATLGQLGIKLIYVGYLD